MKKPNVVFILADDMGYGDVSTLNESCGFKTPNLDIMCENGIAFTDAHSTSSVCTPSRYGILTGRYSWRSKLKKNVLGGYSTHLIEKGRSTLANLFKKNGYYTAAIGKWHLGMDLPINEDFIERPHFASSYDLNDGIDYDKEISNSPLEYGFDYFYGVSGSLDIPPYVYIENNRFTATPTEVCRTKKGKGWYRPGPKAHGFNHENVLDELTEKVLELIEKKKNSPFFIYFPLTAPHGPILPVKRFQGKSHTNDYGDFVLQCDDVVGRVIDKLKETNLYEDTIVVFTSDNGCSTIADYEELAKKGHNPSYKFRGTKWDIYEGGHRIPYIIQWPAYIKKNQTCHRTVCLSDFYATISELLQYKLEENEAVDSISNLSLWKDAESKAVRQYTIHQSVDGSLAIRWGEFKLEMCSGSGHPQKDAIEDKVFRYQLYNLHDDIAETKNVILEYPDIYKKLRDELKKIVINGRSTPGIKQKNNGELIWESIAWMEESTYSIDEKSLKFTEIDME